MAKLILALGVAVLLVLAGLALWLDRPADSLRHRDLAGQKVEITAGAIYSSQFGDTDGKEQVLGQWQHNLLVLNFWATWCTPCKEEMPMLAKVQEKYRSKGLQIVGIAVDSHENVAKFAQKWPVGYPLLPDEQRAIEFSRRLGNRFGLLPFTVVIRPGGEVIFTRVGKVSEPEMIDIIEKNSLK